MRELGIHDTLIERLARALAPEPPLLVRDGGAIAAGYDASLDELRGLRDDSRRLIAELQQRYAQESGVASLKIKHHNVLAYFIEVTPTQDRKSTRLNSCHYSASRMPSSAFKIKEILIYYLFVRRRTSNTAEQDNTPPTNILN